MSRVTCLSVCLSTQMLGENQQECPQWLASMAMYGGGGGGGGGGRRTRGGSKGGRNFGARDFRKDGGGGGGAHVCVGVGPMYPGASSTQLLVFMFDVYPPRVTQDEVHGETFLFFFVWIAGQRKGTESWLVSRGKCVDWMASRVLKR